MTSRSVLKSFTTLSLNLRDIVPSGLMYYTISYSVKAPAKSSMPVHSKKIMPEMQIFRYIEAASLGGAVCYILHGFHPHRPTNEGRYHAWTSALESACVDNLEAAALQVATNAALMTTYTLRRIWS
ncbi:uncharacterized protein LOC100381966 [Zea mays]|jgi:hypothetical protein|uniref:Uncharacterized protein n=1 Tax=Zea mays TaxID=4577 RepID=C0P395_MAIZE|nr:uncharacterized protein LOC100381966 [Zea mays]ACN27461.1 unknown [Zea mays]|eukprot:NP_001168210.1 uncharacterized protein LOC100381966 [Zea mays]